MWPDFLSRRRRRRANFRARGDAARDARDWPAAAAAYRRHLKAVPDDGAIWVQCGHALKEAGDLRGAIKAYRRAVAIPESAAEGLFQLGLALRTAGRPRDSRQALSQALRLEPRFDIYRELADEVAPIPLALPASGQSVLALDVTDLLGFLIAHGFVTGIQRVQLGLIAAILRSETPPTDRFDAIVFCFAEFGRPWRLRTEDLLALLRYVEARTVDLSTARRLVDRAKIHSLGAAWGPGSAYLVLGAFWAGGGLAPLQQGLQSAGVAFGVLIHDLFPITAPQLSEEGAVASFESRLRAGLAGWDFIVANSAATARDVGDYIARHAARAAIPVIATPLAHDFTTAAEAPTAPTAELPAGLEGQRFVLCVGTIEPRKNHRFLIEAWTTLAQRHANLPELVIAGRPGWRSESLVSELKRGALPKVRWLEDMSDAQLDGLYRRCLFTVLPSLAEGWGLPIGESLVHGKVCVTSGTSAMPEVGGRFAVYIDPLDVRSLEAALETLIYDADALPAREAEIRAAFRPRTWSDVASSLIAGVGAATRAEARPESGHER